MNIFESGIIVGLIMALNDLLSMGITKEIVIGNLANNWLVIAFFLYGVQIIIFYNGIKFIPMSTLNLSWNLCSTTIITIIGLYYYKENISHIELWGIGFALFALFLFSYAQGLKINK
jgi:multidrug transporter EmrE-like cation transporter